MSTLAFIPADLKRALTALSAAIPARSSLAAWHAVRIEAAAGASLAYLTARTPDHCLTLAVPLDHAPADAVALHCELPALKRAVAGLKGKAARQPLELFARADGVAGLVMVHGRARLPLGGVKESDLWTLPEHSGLRAYAEANAPAALDLFARIVTAASDEETRYYLQGVHVAIDGSGALTATATDGVLMARDTLRPIHPSNVQAGAALLGKDAIGLAAKLAAYGRNVLTGHGLGSTLNIALFDEWGRLEGPGFVLAVREIDGTFPDIDAALARWNDARPTAWHVSGEALTAFAKAQAVSGAKRAVALSLSPDAEPLTYTPDPEGWGRAPGRVEGEAVRTACNARVLSRLAATVPGAGGASVRIEAGPIFDADGKFLRQVPTLRATAEGFPDYIAHAFPMAVAYVEPRRVEPYDVRGVGCPDLWGVEASAGAGREGHRWPQGLDKPRVAGRAEVLAYVEHLARAAGCALPVDRCPADLSGRVAVRVGEPIEQAEGETGPIQYPEGALSVLIPGGRGLGVTFETLADDGTPTGEPQPIATHNGALRLSQKAVRAAVGEVEGKPARRAKPAPIAAPAPTLAVDPRDRMKVTYQGIRAGRIYTGQCDEHCRDYRLGRAVSRDIMRLAGALMNADAFEARALGLYAAPPAVEPPPYAEPLPSLGAPAAEVEPERVEAPTVEAAPAGAVEARLARIEAALGIATRPEKTAAHRRAIQRAWDARRRARNLLARIERAETRARLADAEAVTARAEVRTMRQVIERDRASFAEERAHLERVLDTQRAGAAQIDDARGAAERRERRQANRAARLARRAAAMRRQLAASRAGETGLAQRLAVMTARASADGAEIERLRERLGATAADVPSAPRFIMATR